MEFDPYLKDAWRRHGDEPQAVFDGLTAGRALARSASDVVAWAGLATHVAGEHLGRWADGLRLLEDALDDPRLSGHDVGRRSVHRSRAVLLLASGDRERAEVVLRDHADPSWPAASSRVRVFATASAALSARGDVDRARSIFEEALAAAGYEPGAEDPAARSLAITGNNLAMDLEDLLSRSPAQDELMVLAARTSRAWWEVAGDATNVLLADVCVASALLATGDAEGALSYAEAAASASEEKDVLAGFRIQAMLVLGRAALGTRDPERARGALAAADEAFSRLPEAYHGFYGPRMEALRASLVGG